MHELRKLPPRLQPIGFYQDARHQDLSRRREGREMHRIPEGRGFGMTGITGLIWLTGASVVGLVSGLVVIAVEEVGRRRNG